MPPEERPNSGGEGSEAHDASGADGPTPSRGADTELDFREVVHSQRTGEQYVRITRPAGGGIRRRGGHLEATRRSLRPRSGAGRAFGAAKALLVGDPLATEELAHERLSKVKALAVLSSDALSSSAYATEEILLVLVLAGSGALDLTLPVTLAILVLLGIVAFSYRQTIQAYPQGGGSYIVSKDNLGTWASLIAGAALLVDYVLTVAVSISAGTAAITSALPSAAPFRVEIAIGFIALITVVNLRGVRESGSIFAAPTYLFIGSASLMIGVGLARLALGGLEPVTSEFVPPTEALTTFLILRAFASGCAALTGTEAISDGVPAFKPPEWKNARATLAWMAVLLAGLFFGISFLARQLNVLPSHDETVVSQIARAIFGDGPLYYLMQVATMLILVLAANTSFSDFPRLSYFLARDHFLPSQFQFRGDRLAFSTGILVLGICAAVVVWQFEARTDALIPLYAVGVFVAFTFSQSAMVRRWWSRREAGWQRGLVINGLGAVTTGVVAIEIATVKFTSGAWIVLIIIPTLVMIMRAINAHYVAVRDQVARGGGDGPVRPLDPPPHVVVPVPDLNKVVARTVALATSLSPHVIAVHVTDDCDAGELLRERWQREVPDVPLTVLDSPYRSLVAPFLAYIDALQAHEPTRPIVVVLSEFVPRHFWEYPLHNQTALRLKGALFFRPNTAVIDVPYHLER
ncbi:MAG: amino acid transporter [Chloroflexi bacterium]|nr:amino acid transporter [Chloroflexota bacterium]